MLYRVLASLVIGFCATKCAVADTFFVLDAKNRVVGYLFSEACFEGSEVPEFSAYSWKGYFACIAGDDGSIRAPTSPVNAFTLGNAQYYASADCTGQAYQINGTAFAGGFVFPLEGFTRPRFVPTGTVSTAVQINSLDAGSGCGPSSDGTVQALPQFPNDIATTGFSSVHYAAPFNIVYLPESVANDEIFFDTFE